MEQLSNNINSERRKFLKILLIGGGGFLLGRLFRPVAKFFSNSSFEVNNSLAQAVSTGEVGPKPPAAILPKTDLGEKTDFKNFKVIEKKESMVFVDKKANEEILILDWGEEDR